jgi:hypothetical protein
MDDAITLARDAASTGAGVEAAVNIPGLRVVADNAVAVASLRYFSTDGHGPFAQAVQRETELMLPGVLKASAGSVSSDAQWILAWRSPTETLAIARAASVASGTEGGAHPRAASIARAAQLAAAVAECPDGCLVDQTGGQCVLLASGPRISDLLIRLGSATSVPGTGESRRSRLADVPVLAVCVEAGETLLIVERVYRDHLLAWIRETSADLVAHP